MTASQDEPTAFTESILPAQSQAVAPDGSYVRLLCRTEAGSFAHFELPAGQTSRAVRHRTITEIWYVTEGLGQMWRGEQPTDGREIDLRPGVCLTIPPATSFQFRSTSGRPLAAVAVTMPPWPGDDEAVVVEGPWQATL
jgi:mannose-6-phosphate isomerase-like protein (cupin superfamily)